MSERGGWTLPDLAAACLSGGARLFQIRAKRAPSGWLLETACAVCEMAHREGGRVIVNDRPDIARLSGADGVHVGQGDLPAEAARTLVGDDAIVGLSTHTADQLADAVGLGVLSYVACGPVFDTATKATGFDAGGLDMVRRAAAATHPSGLPLVAIGGITLDTAARVIDAGAAAVAVIADLLATNDPEARVREFLRRV